MLVAENQLHQVSLIRTDQSTSLSNPISTYTDTKESSEIGSSYRAMVQTENLEKSITKSKKKPNVKEAIIVEVDHENEYKQLPDVVASSHLGNYRI